MPIVALVAVLLLAGCGRGDADRGEGVRVVVTDDFGRTSIVDRRGVKVPSGGASVATVLNAVGRVGLTPDRRAVASIDGRAAAAGSAWTYWVNGIPAETGTLDDKLPSDRQRYPDVRAVGQKKVYDGDVLWIDRHSTSGAARPRGVVGSFPEPFSHGADGKRYPLRVECADPRSKACRMVGDALVKYDLPVSVTGLRSSYNPETARISVGTWSQVRDDPAARLAEDGAAVSGVYVRPAPDGRSFGLLDQTGRVARTVGAGSGLVFASRYRDEPPSWIVTGTDDASVQAAAAALDPAKLSDRLAALVQGPTITALPVDGPSAPAGR